MAAHSLVCFGVVLLMVVGSNAFFWSRTPTATATEEKAMKGCHIAVIWFLLGAILDSHGQDVHFHCERSAQHCVHTDASCDFGSGQCADCPSDFAGYNCGFNVTDYTTTACGLNCQNSATCFTNGADELCLCTPDFYGPLCEQERVAVSCNGENMTVTVSPIQPFSGLMYLGDLDPDPDCLLEIDIGNTVYSLTLPLDSDCTPTVVNDSLTGDITYSRELTLQYDAIFQSGHDLSINLTCFHSANYTREPGHVLGAPQTSKSEGGNIQTLYQPAQLAILYPDTMTHVDGVVTVGQRLALFNYLNDDSVFKKLRVIRCIISNPSFTKTLTLVDNGCPTDRAQALGVSQALAHSSPPGVKHEFSMIRFGTEKQVMFSCVVRMCQGADDVMCQKTDCTNSRRRREATGRDYESRDVTATDLNEQVTRTSLIVLDPNQEEDQQISSQECLRQSTIQAVIASLASVVAVLLIFCCVMALYFRGSNRRLRVKERSISNFSNDGGSGYQEFTSRQNSESANYNAVDKSSIGRGRFSLPSINLYRY